MKKHHSKHSKVLLNLIDKHSFVNMVEIGLGSGDTAKFILDHLVPSYPFVYYGIDPFKSYDEYVNDINSSVLRIMNNRNACENNLSKFQNGKFVHFQLSSAVASLKFKKKTIDLLFIDGNHSYEYVKSDLEKYWPLVKNNGIIAIHDYKHLNFPGVKKAVDKFLKDYKHLLVFDEGIVYFYKSIIIESNLNLFMHTHD